MPTQAEKDVQLAKLAELSEWVSTLAPEPPPTGGKVVDAAATPSERSLTVTWTAPAGATAVLVAWGDDSGYLSSSGLLLPTVTSYVAANLRPVPHRVDILVSMRADLELDPASKVTLDATPLPGPVLPGWQWPAAGTWDDKRDWVISVAGAPDSGLKVVDSQASLSAAGLPGSWNTAGRFWDLPSSTATFDGLDVRGEIFVRGRLAALHSVKCQGVRFMRDNNANNGLEVRLTECGLTKHPTFPVGNGSLNTWGRPVLVLKRTDHSGHADGIQHAGQLDCEESHFHDQIYNETSHNDWCQGYGNSSEEFRRCYMLSGAPLPNHQNGLIFTDHPSPAGADVIDSVLVVQGPHRATSWAANAYMGPYRFLRCLVDGKTVGRQSITFTESEHRV